MLYIIGSQFEPEAEDYADRLNEEWNWQFKRYKYKPQVQVRTYSKLMSSLDSRLMGTDIGGFELERVRRDVPLLYELKTGDLLT